MQVEGHEIIIGGATIQDSARVLGLGLDLAAHPDGSHFIPIWAPWPDDDINTPQVAPDLLIGEEHASEYGTDMVCGFFSL